MRPAVPIFRRLEQRLVADPTRVVVRPFHLAWQSRGFASNRAVQLVNDILAMDEAAVLDGLNSVLGDFEGRHWQIGTRVHDAVHGSRRRAECRVHAASHERRMLIGAYFCHEYSYPPPRS